MLEPVIMFCPMGFGWGSFAFHGIHGDPLAHRGTFLFGAYVLMYLCLCVVAFAVFVLFLFLFFGGANVST